MTPYEFRYRRGDVKQPSDIETNEFIERQFSRRTIRHYDPTRKISDEQLNYLISAAQCAPSSSGAGSWSVIVLTEAEEKEKFRLAAGQVLSRADVNNYHAYQNCSAFLIWILDNHKLERAIRLTANKKIHYEILQILPDKFKEYTGGDPDLNWEYGQPLFDADQHVAWLDQSYYSFRAMTDCTVAAQAFVMCAESIGLSTMYMGSIAHCNISSFRNVLKLPDRTFPIFGMCVGYEHPDGTDHHGLPKDKRYIDRYNSIPGSRIKPLQPLSLVVHRGEYRTDTMDQDLLTFNSTMWNYNKYVNPLRPSDMLGCRATARTKFAKNHLEMMREMNNKFL